MSLIDNTLNILTSLLGGFLLILIAIISIFSSIAALLTISEENRIVFYRSKRIFGIIISFFGFLLYFRKISFIAPLLCFSWTSIFFDIFSKFLLIQVIATIIGSFITWIYYFYCNNIIFLQVIGDSFLFIILPLSIAIVDLSRGSELLSGKEKSNYNGPYIKLRSFLSKLYSYIEKFFPAD